MEASQDPVDQQIQELHELFDHGKRDGHTFQLIGLGGPRKAMVQIGG